MTVYSIRDLERLSGIKAHTIRAWEHRYGIIRPQRSKTNIRFYCDEDVRLLLNIALLNRNGLRIGTIAAMSPQEMAERVARLTVNSTDETLRTNTLMLCLTDMDESKFDHLFNDSVERIGFERTLLELIFPFLEKLGLVWMTGTLKPVQEQFMTCLIRRKIIARIDATEPPARSRGMFLLYLPDNERQELSLLFMHYLVRSRGFRTIYLGSDVSLVDLVDACEIHQPDYFYTMISESFIRTPVGNYVAGLTDRFPDTTLLLSGYQPVAQRVPNSKRVQVLRSLEETIRFVEGIS